MNAPRSNVASWAKAGRDAGNTYADISATTAKYSPKYGKLAELGIQARAKVKESAINAERKVRVAEKKAEGLIDRQNIAVDEFKSINESKRGQRKAGMVAAAGSAIALGLQKDTELPPVNKAIDYSAIEKFYESQTARNNADEAKIRADMKKDTTTATATTTTKPGSTSFKPVKGTGGVKLMNFLVNQRGYKPVTAAAVAGNAAHESANFTAHEEFVPNAYGTKGVGFLQWTNADRSKRRDQFESYARSQNLDPTSFEASAGYIDAEMKGGSHWTGGMTTDSFKGIQDLNTAVTAFQNNYLRPAKATANTGARLNYANQFLQQYNNQ